MEEDKNINNNKNIAACKMLKTINREENGKFILFAVVDPTNGQEHIAHIIAFGMPILTFALTALLALLAVPLMLMPMPNVAATATNDQFQSIRNLI